MDSAPDADSKKSQGKEAGSTETRQGRKRSVVSKAGAKKAGRKTNAEKNAKQGGPEQQF